VIVQRVLKRRRLASSLHQGGVCRYVVHEYMMRMRGMREVEKKGARYIIKYAHGVLVTCETSVGDGRNSPSGRIMNYIYVWVTARSKRKRKWDESWDQRG